MYFRCCAIRRFTARKGCRILHTATRKYYIFCYLPKCSGCVLRIPDPLSVLKSKQALALLAKSNTRLGTFAFRLYSHIYAVICKISFKIVYLYLAKMENARCKSCICFSVTENIEEMLRRSGSARCYNRNIYRF